MQERHASKKNCKSIGLFGSSFNPPHQGHLAVLKDLCNSKVFDEIWLVPVYSHPFGKALISFEHRCHMVKLLISKLAENSIKINLIEQELNKAPTYAIDVVRALKSRHPDCDFHLIVGSDIKPDLQKWHKIDELKQEAKFHFVPRNGYENSPYPKVSSSEIRELAASKKPLKGLPIAIAEYISKKNLYSHS